MRRCKFFTSVVFSLGALLVPTSLQVRADEAVEARLRHDIDFLASDACEGRGIRTKGINLAAEFIADEFKKAGLRPGGVESTYFQPFTIPGSAKLLEPNALILHGPLGQEIRLSPGRDFQVMGLSSAAKVSAPLVFVGYGATAKEIGYDDFKNLEVAGKIVIMIRKTPRPDHAQAPFNGNNSAYHSALSTKIFNAEQHKAAAVILVNDRVTAQNGDPLMEFSYSARDTARLPCVHLRRAVADAILQAGFGRTLREVEEDIDRDLQPRSAPLAGWSAMAETNVVREQVPVKNIVGVLEGSGPLANETVIVGAHYDHLGYGGFGSLARGAQAKAIHHGADDNGSGTTTVLELARYFARQPQRQGRRLVFMTFSGEELGLLGSIHYCKEPIFPLANTVAMVNLDMVGRLRPDKKTGKEKLTIGGTGTAKSFDKLLDDLNTGFDFQIHKDPAGTGPSDHDSFYRKGIPVFFFFTDYHEDYHRPSDTSDKINVAGMAKIASFTENLIAYLTTVPERPQYVKLATREFRQTRAGGPSLGFMPTYEDQKDGVLMGPISKGGPAEKAGLKEGDRIMEMDGKPVKNLEAYMALKAGYKKGDTIKVGIDRNGKRLVIPVHLE